MRLGGDEYLAHRAATTTLYNEEINMTVRVDHRPIEPARRVVLVVRVVVAALGAPDSSPPSSIGTPRDSIRMVDEVLDLPRAQRRDPAIGRRTLARRSSSSGCCRCRHGSFAVCLVVLLVVRDEVVQREAVVDRDEVDAVLRRLPARLIDVGAAARAVRPRAPSQAGIAFHEPANVVSIAAVPLGPAIAGKVPDLVQARGIPRFRDQLGVGERVFELDLPDDRRMDERRAVLAASENRASSNRKPSTCMSCTQYRRQSTMNFCGSG